MSNASILDRNICHAFEAAGPYAPIIEDAYWRFRNRDTERLAEHKALVLARALGYLNVAFPVVTTPDKERARIEVTDFLVERLRALPGPVDPFALPPVSATLAVADKIDTLMGFFGIEERPDGSGDPFALRRAANGILRIAAAYEPPLSPASGDGGGE